MISKEYGKYTYICDVCGAGTDIEFDTFIAAAEMKCDVGWASQRNGNKWVDACPECQEGGGLND